MGNRLLLIETDHALCTVLKQSLESEGYNVTVAVAIEEILLLDVAHDHDIALIDTGCNGMDERDLSEQIQKHFPLGLILMGSRTSLNTRICIHGFDADDYLVKPFTLRDMHHKVSNLLHRSGTKTRLHFGGWILDTASRTLRDEAGHTVSLTESEYRLLETMAHRAGIIFSRTQLLKIIHDYDTYAYDRSIDVAIMRLRRKLGDGGADARLIKTVRGSGYIFAAEVEA